MRRCLSAVFASHRLNLPGAPGPVRFVASLVWLSVSLISSPAAAQDAPRWSITPYLWATDTSVDLSIGSIPIGEGEVSFDDLLDTLDSAFMIQTEYGQGRWSAFGDLTYLETSDSEQRPLLIVQSDSKQVFLDAAAGYWPSGVGQGFNLFGGIRYASFDDRYRFSVGGQPVADRRSDADYTDVLVGARYIVRLSERWEMMLRADTSFGDTEGTWLGRAHFAYVVGQRRQNRIVLGYEFKKAEYQNGDLNLDYAFQGPTAGFSFRF